MLPAPSRKNAQPESVRRAMTHPRRSGGASLSRRSGGASLSRTRTPFGTLVAIGAIAAIAAGCATGTASSEDDGLQGTDGGKATGDGGTIQCRAPLVVCDGVCLDPSKDITHCGATGDCSGAQAGSVCPLGVLCTNGACSASCPKGSIVCDGACVDPLSDKTHCGASGDCLGPRAGTACAGATTCAAGTCGGACTGTKTFAFTGAPEMFVVPSCATKITVEARGAQGGTSTGASAGGFGAVVQGTMPITGGTTLTIVVGEQPPAAQYANGGGGGSYVAAGTTPLFVAGGGGGGYNTSAQGGSSSVLTTSGTGAGGTSHNDAGGGGGFTTAGAGTSGSGGGSFVSGSAAGAVFPAGNVNCSRGGFGGGGGGSQSSTFNAAGGGGYVGGNAGNGNASTGGTSFIAPTATGTSHTPAVQTGMGKVVVSW